ncbi:MAG: 50S ribosomal protein L29 [Deltaproteobacteria bacterium]|nr:50S ribosomal protein L29 [Deltaproteobacteria bacterium]MBW2051730.1 50S ribosomal protein L29 [Deltaproteobacteria bacterium]MBW2140269.1 50S ribosomal protein L29 [Deltaproteobacteria bacterium]MBW2322112.1 50S ribosomal protein L29 [Deltaproteobacteria bacterium]
MKASEIRDLSLEELVEKERELREELFNFNFQNATNQLENTARIPQTRKEIARIRTIIREKGVKNRSGEEA